MQELSTLHEGPRASLVLAYHSTANLPLLLKKVGLNSSDCYQMKDPYEAK